MRNQGKVLNRHLLFQWMTRNKLFLSMLVFIAAQPTTHATMLRNIFSKSRLASIALYSQLAFSAPFSASAETLQDQLKVIQALQTEQQKERVIQTLNEERKQALEADVLVARGTITLPPTGLANGVDPTQLPFGFAEAASIDPEFGNEKAALIITAVGRNGPPVAAKKLKLAGLQFPLSFDLTDRDLMFPYTREAWLKSPLSKDSISVTCILDTDGKLVTPSSVDRFGFAISDYIEAKTDYANKDLNREKPERALAQVSINLKSDGRSYSKEELETLTRVDAEIDRITRNQ
jgi:hypothetical protein